MFPTFYQHFQQSTVLPVHISYFSMQKDFYIIKFYKVLPFQAPQPIDFQYFEIFRPT